MLSSKKVIEKCNKQKNISTHLVLPVMEKLQKELDELRDKHRDLQNSSNKHHQFLKTEIQQLKEKNRKLREGSK